MKTEAGLYSISDFYHWLSARIAGAEQKQRPLAVAVFQVPAEPDGRQLRELERTLCRSVRKGGLWFVLRTPWQRLTRFVERPLSSKADIPARLSAQKFAVILSDTNQVAAAVDRISRELSRVAEGPIMSGFACYPGDGQTATELIQSATTHSQTATASTKRISAVS